MLTVATARPSLQILRPLEGQTVLLAHDECGADQLFEDILWNAGASVVLAQNAYQAEHIANCHALSSAVLVAGIGADTTTRILACLACREVPYVFVSAAPTLDTETFGPHDFLATLAREPRRH